MTDLDELERLARAALNARNGIGAEAADWNSRAHANEDYDRVVEDPATILELIRLAREAEGSGAAAVHERDLRDRAEAELKALRERINRTLDGVVEDMHVALNVHGAMSVELAIAGVRRALEPKP